MFQKICKPKLDEGASCGGVTPLGIFRIAIGKRDIEAQQKITNPCKTGLKCEEAGLVLLFIHYRNCLFHKKTPHRVAQKNCLRFD